MPLQPRRTLPSKPKCACAGSPASPAAGSENRGSGSSASTVSTVDLGRSRKSLRPAQRAEHNDYDADTSDREPIVRSFEAHTWRTVAFEAQAREEAAAERVAALAAAVTAAEAERDNADAAGRAHLASLAAVVRDKEALEVRLTAAQSRAEEAVVGARSIAAAGDKAVAGLRAEVADAVARYTADMEALAADAAAMRDLLARLTAVAERPEKEGEEKAERSLSRALSTLRRRKKHPLEELADEGALPVAVSVPLLIREKKRLQEELEAAKKERAAAAAHARGAEERETLHALEAVGEVARAIRGRVQVCAACRGAVLEAVAAAEEEVSRKYERGVAQG